MNFAELLKYHMNQRGLSQYSLSKLCEIQQSTISRYLNGELSPTLDKIVKISESLGMTLSEFFNSDSVKLQQATKPMEEGFVAAISDQGENLSPEQAQALAQAAADQTKRRRRLHHELDKLLDEFENKTHGS